MYFTEALALRGVFRTACADWGGVPITAVVVVGVEFGVAGAVVVVVVVVTGAGLLFLLSLMRIFNEGTEDRDGVGG